MWFKGLLDKRFLIGRRLVVNFPNAQPAQVGIFELSSARSLRFTIQEVEKNARIAYVLVMMTDQDSTEIASFESKPEALLALKKISNKFRWTVLRLVKWIFVSLLLLLVFDFFATVSGAFDSRPAANRGASNGAPMAPVDPQTMRMLEELARKGPAPGVNNPISAAPEVTSSPEAAAAIDALRGPDKR